jgi:hypothetical protein
MGAQGVCHRLREGIAVNGERTAGRQAVCLGGRHDQPARLPHLPVQETNGIPFVIVRAEGVRADHLGKVAGAMGEGRDLGAHFMDMDAHAKLGRLPCGLRPGHAATDDVEYLAHGVDLGQPDGFGKHQRPTISRSRQSADYRRCGYRNL